MEEGRPNILKESKRILSKLQLLSVFFANDTIYKIFLRSQVIHQLFENNEDLDINKLELFHIQFTASVIELLKKIKKGNEKKVSLLADEVRLNEELIAKIKETGFAETAYKLEMQRQSLKMRRSLEALYQGLSYGGAEYPIAKNIQSFSARFAATFYYPISGELMEMLTRYEEADVYSNTHTIKIQRKLMGLLCKHDFRISFFCGLTYSSLIIEVYKFIDVDIFFVFYPSRDLILLCDATEMHYIQQANEKQRQDNVLSDLMNKVDRIKGYMGVAKVYIPDEIEKLLEEHYQKISDINFLQNLTNFDALTNILKTMLNTKII